LAFKITYKASITGDLHRLDRPTAKRVLDKFERTLSANPDAGLPLTGEFKGLFKYRIGDYRVVYAKTVDGILVLRLGHRKDVYR